MVCCSELEPRTHRRVLAELATVGLAPAVFGPWMNISGSSLATWWREKPIPDAVDEIEKPENTTNETNDET